jgi:predicted RNA binding protein YcfA (HicA-like mRNA interferase family)
MSSREVLKRLKAAGFEEVRQKGSHIQLWNEHTRRMVTVKHPTKDYPIGTLKSMERQSGVKLT